jgi:hypothetical protein
MMFRFFLSAFTRESPLFFAGFSPAKERFI